MITYASADELEAAIGVEVGPSDWLEIDQSRIDTFADATLDHQWIHVDADKAKDGPFGATVAHGFLTVSLLPYLVNSLRRIDNVAMGVNYGLNKVRFPAPVRVGSRVRARMTLLESDRIGDKAVQLVNRVTIDLDGGDKPACVAELVSRHYFN